MVDFFLDKDRQIQKSMLASRKYYILKANTDLIKICKQWDFYYILFISMGKWKHVDTTVFFTELIHCYYWPTGKCLMGLASVTKAANNPFFKRLQEYAGPIATWCDPWGRVLMIIGLVWHAMLCFKKHHGTWHTSTFSRDVLLLCLLNFRNKIDFCGALKIIWQMRDVAKIVLYA